MLFYSMIAIILFLIAETNAVPVLKESGPKYLYNYGYLSTDAGSEGNKWCHNSQKYLFTNDNLITLKCVR